MYISIVLQHFVFSIKWHASTRGPRTATHTCSRQCSWLSKTVSRQPTSGMVTCCTIWDCVKSQLSATYPSSLPTKLTSTSPRLAREGFGPGLRWSYPKLWQPTAPPSSPASDTSSQFHRHLLHLIQNFAGCQPLLMQRGWHPSPRQWCWTWLMMTQPPATAWPVCYWNCWSTHRQSHHVERSARRLESTGTKVSSPSAESRLPAASARRRPARGLAACSPCRKTGMLARFNLKFQTALTPKMGWNIF